MLNWSLFKKGRAQAPGTAALPAGYIPYKSAASLLDTPRRKRLIENIWHRTSVSKAQFNKIYYEPICRYVELVQQLPASENHHHAYLGGMIDHGLEIIAYALKIRQSYVLPIGSTAEQQSSQSEAWSAGVAFSALLHDIGKIAVDVSVQLKSGKTWRAWHGPMNEDYRFEYVKGRKYNLHGAAAGLLFNKVLLPDQMDWLAQYRELWSSMLFVLAGQSEHAGVLADIVQAADQASVASELGGNPDRAIAAPKNTIQKQLIEGLRYLIKNELKLNQSEASDGWYCNDAVWLVSKTVSDRLRAHMLSTGAEGVPDRNATLFNILQDNSIIVVNPSGKAIWEADVASPTGWKHSFTFLRVSPSIIWLAGEDRPESFAGTVTPTTKAQPEQTEENSSKNEIGKTVVSTAMPTQASAPATEPVSGTPVQDDIDDLLNIFDFDSSANNETGAVLLPPPPVINDPYDLVGETTVDDESVDTVPGPVIIDELQSGETLGHQFMHWLKMGIGTHKIIINDVKAKVHTVEGTGFIVTPGIFRRYVQEHPQLFDKAGADNDQAWSTVQKSFEKLKANVKKSNGLNIWTCTVVGARKSGQLKGYLLKRPTDIFTTEMMDNPSLVLVKETT
ncbi:hypothetical protein ALP05_04369 [Pseudomonas caricapapayae]|uniref:Relaxase n=1 Tax=Pseudomonas caricapapayae TaxID=46678 RepID=A0A3M6FEW8_9PSED|nr:MobH family relaxase [Pseudomonas caricapapayae]RMV79090.1 hypothetical protein ALP05_04369 [Pseudomonas caricapapayae]